MMTVDDALDWANTYQNGFDDDPVIVLAAEVSRLRDEVNGLTGSLDRAESVLQNLMSYLAVNGCRTEIDPENAELRIRDGIDMLVRPVLERAERAEAELKELRKQEPVATVKYHDTGGNVGLTWRAIPTGAFYPRDGEALYARPIPAPAVPDEWLEAAQRLIDAAGDKTCAAHRCHYPMDCCSNELIGAMDGLSALLQSVPQAHNVVVPSVSKEAWDAACAFIDSHVADPDITDEMAEKYAAFQMHREFVEQHIKDH